MFNLQEALEAIKNKPEFRHNLRESFSVIDYQITTRETFEGKDEREELVLRNLRGTCFNNDGKIISLGYDKFHNLGETTGWLEQDIDFKQPHAILKKEDGSMVRPIPIADGWRFGTRAGITDVAMMAEKWYETYDYKRQYDNLVQYCLQNEYTPIFEFCSLQNKIVVMHNVTRLVLTGVRSNITGTYFPFESFDCSGIEVVQSIRMDNKPLAEVAAEVRSWPNTEEGVVIRFNDGFMVKIKGDAYVKIHRTLDGIKFEKDVLAMIVSNELDDVLPLLSEGDYSRVTAYRDSVVSHMLTFTTHIHTIYDSISNTDNPKEFATRAKTTGMSQFMFNIRKGRLDLNEYVLKNCSSSTTVESIRNVIGPTFYTFA